MFIKVITFIYLFTYLNIKLIALQDHMHGLENPNFKEKVYFTEQTALLLLFMEKRTSKQLTYSHLKELVIPVPYHETIIFEISQHSSIELTFLPANHCPTVKQNQNQNLIAPSFIFLKLITSSV